MDGYAMGGGSVAIMSQLLVNGCDDFLTRRIEGVGINVDAVAPAGESGEAEAVLQPIREIVGLELQAKTGRDEVVIEGRMADASDPVAELLEGAGFQVQRRGHFHGLAKIEWLEGGKLCIARLGFAMFRNHAEKIAAQLGHGEIIANIDS